MIFIYNLNMPATILEAMQKTYRRKFIFAFSITLALILSGFVLDFGLKLNTLASCLYLLAILPPLFVGGKMYDEIKAMATQKL